LPARRRAVATVEALSFIVAVPSLLGVFWSDRNGSAAVVAVVARLLPWVITASAVEHDRFVISTNHRFARVAAIDRRLEASNCVKRTFPSVTSRVRFVRLSYASKVSKMVLAQQTVSGHEPMTLPRVSLCWSDRKGVTRRSVFMVATAAVVVILRG
jgi:hypothetical protein